MDELNIVVIDFETTGLTPPVCAVEFAYVRISEQMDVLDEYVTLVNPGRAIEPGAIGVHGITDAEVAEAISIEQAIAPLQGSPVVVIGHNCVTPDHEVRTRNGWVAFSKLPKGAVEALAWDPVTGVLEFQQCLHIEQNFTGDLFVWDTQFHQGAYTPDHRLFYRTPSMKEGPWKVGLAKELATRAPNSLSIPTGGIWHSEAPQWLTVDEARVLEMSRADGNISEAGDIRFSFKKDRKILRLRQLLAATGDQHKEVIDSRGVTRIRIYRSPLTKKIASLLGGGKNKKYGPWLLDLPVPVRETILDELVHWDGYIKHTGGKRATLLHTSCRETAYWISELATLTGKLASARYDKPNTRGFSRPDGVLHEISIRPRTRVKTLRPPVQVPYRGKVHCLTTSTGAFLVRRNGATWVTGNCSFDLRIAGPHLEVVGEVCTLALSRQYVTGAANHKLTTIRDHLGLPDFAAHRALGDAHTSLNILRRILNDHGLTLDQVIKRQSKPRMLSLMPFGKYGGRPVVDVPKDYRQWLLNAGNLDKDLEYTLRKLESL